MAYNKWSPNYFKNITEKTYDKYPVLNAFDKDAATASIEKQIKLNRYNENKNKAANASYITDYKLHPDNSTSAGTTNLSSGLTGGSVKGSYNANVDDLYDLLRAEADRNTIDKIGSIKDKLGYKSLPELNTMYNDYARAVRDYALAAEKLATDSSMNQIIQSFRNTEADRQNELAAQAMNGGNALDMFASNAQRGQQLSSAVSDTVNSLNDKVTEIEAQYGPEAAKAYIDAYVQSANDTNAANTIRTNDYNAASNVLGYYLYGGRNSGTGSGTTTTSVPNSQGLIVDEDGNVTYTEDGFYNRIIENLGESYIPFKEQIDSLLPSLYVRYLEGDLGSTPNQIFTEAQKYIANHTDLPGYTNESGDYSTWGNIWNNLWHPSNWFDAIGYGTKMKNAGFGIQNNMSDTEIKAAVDEAAQQEDPVAWYEAMYGPVSRYDYPDGSYVLYVKLNDGSMLPLYQNEPDE